MQEMQNIERATTALQEVENRMAQQRALSEGQKAMRPQYRPLSDDETKRVEVMKDLGAQLWDTFHGLGHSRETSLAKTHLEDAVMWAMKHITR